MCPVDAIRLVHPIEAESYRILRSTVDTARLQPLSRNVAERIIHTTADPAWRDDLVLDERALSQGAQALAEGAPLIVDVNMVAAGITRYPTICHIDNTPEPGLTRAATGFRRAARQYPTGAVWVVGNAPTALYELLRLSQTNAVTPALVIGLPVGFVGAAESKQALRETTLPQLSNVSARGGAAVAAAAVNALLYGDPLKEDR
nr:precorrin-8X methylmutase [Allorhizocola rhizosphaerae]